MARLRRHVLMALIVPEARTRALDLILVQQRYYQLRHEDAATPPSP
jgi:hypothetical protein